MSFLRTRDFLFFRKMVDKSFSSSQMGKTPIDIFKDLCLAYADSALSYVAVYG
jgi:hypothetical protein